MKNDSYVDIDINALVTHDEIKEQGGSFIFENRVWTIANTKQYNDYVVNVVHCLTQFWGFVF